MASTIGILQAGAAPGLLQPDFGDYPAFFEELLRQTTSDLRFRVYRVMDGILPKSTAECCGWLITGSRHSVLQQTLWMSQLKDFIRRAMNRRRRLVGICFGHQIMAEALGGEVKRSQFGWAIGRQVYDYVDAKQSPRTIALNAFHQDQVVSIPNQARVIAQSDTCPFAILEYGSTALSIQAHPEFREAFLRALITHRLVGKVSPALIDVALKKPYLETDSSTAARMIANKLLS